MQTIPFIPPSTSGHYASFQVEPTTPHIGADIIGLDITQALTPLQIGELHHAFVQHQVLFFRDQPFALDEHKRFGSYFGALHIHPSAPAHPEHPEVLRIYSDAHSKVVAGEHWHSDVSCGAAPPAASILAMHTVPPCGGDTLFASMFAAYDSLSSPMKKCIEGMTATHDGEQVFRGRFSNYGRPDTGVIHPKTSHPIVRTHPVSKRRALYVNPGFTTHIDGLPRDESAAILAYLYQHSVQAQFQVRFRWQQHSVAFWDNRSTQHQAIWDYFPHVRSGYRVTIQGDIPF